MTSTTRRDPAQRRTEGTLVASTPKLSITHPDGTISRRQTARAYTHVVVATPRDASRYADHIAGRIATFDRHIAELEASIANPEFKLAHRGFPTMGRGSDDVGFDGEPRYTAFALSLVLPTRDLNVCTWTNSQAITENLIPAGDGKYDRQTADGRQEVLAIARRLIGTYTTERSEAQTLLDSVRAGTADLGKYAVARWSTRQELAIRAMAEFDHLRAEGRSLSVVEVDAR